MINAVFSMACFRVFVNGAVLEQRKFPAAIPECQRAGLGVSAVFMDRTGVLG